MTALCHGLPHEWWWTGDDGNRLAMAICRRCPTAPRCREGDPYPHGVLRAGVAYTDDGRAMSECATCGYPRRANHGPKTYQPDTCPRCELPPLVRFRNDIERWAAAGIPNRVIAGRVGATRDQVADAQRDWRSRRGQRNHPAPAICAASEKEHV